LAAHKDAGLIYTNIATIDNQGALIRDPSNSYRCYEGQVTKELLRRNFIPGMTTVLKKSIFDKAGGFNTSIRSSEDYELWLRISKLCKFLYIDESLYLYRRHQNQISTSSRDIQLLAHLDALDIFKNSNPQFRGSRIITRAKAETLKNLGHYYLKKKGDKQLARATFINALRTDPLYFSAINRLIRTYFH
jgi:tetratricopeptide (TPR) repeat protein